MRLWRVFGELLANLSKAFTNFCKFLTSFWCVFGEFLTSLEKLLTIFGELFEFLKVFYDFWRVVNLASLSKFSASLASSCRVFGLFLTSFWRVLDQVFASF